MNVNLNSYPKCKCGNEMVPVYYEEEWEEPQNHSDSRLVKQNILNWKCVNPECKNIVS